MIDRSEFIEELELRESIQKMIRIAKSKRFTKAKEAWLEERKFRELLSELIVEVAAEDPADNPYDSTGINALADMFKNTNYLQVIRSSYKQLTSNEEQRKSFRKMFLNLINRLMIQIANREDAGQDVESAADLKDMSLTEEVEIDIEDDGLNDMSKFIDVPDVTGSSEEEEKTTIDDDPRDVEISDVDKKGSKNALEAFEDVESTIIKHFAGMDEKDREEFRDYALTNTKLYMDQFESELENPANLQEPESPDYDPNAAEADDLPGDEDLGFDLAGDEETEI
tara:strand:+ start:1220 stop:2065 length:846 start_codon:yes stop_codon:yes gene_type:complete